MIHYETLFNYLANRQGWSCAIALNRAGWRTRPDCLHHARKHNTKINRRRWPVFIDSVFNLVAVKNDPWHVQYRNWGCWTGHMQADRYERFLSETRHWKFREFALTGIWPEITG